MEYGQHVTFYPSYGAAMRGGTANCSVIVSGSPIASPIIAAPNMLVAMNEPSLDFFISRLEPKGKLFVNSSLIKKKAGRADIAAHYVPANELAEKLGNGRMANMAMLGAVLAASQMLPLARVQAALEKTFAGKLQKAIKPNQQALQQGYEFMGNGGN